MTYIDLDKEMDDLKLNKSEKHSLLARARFNATISPITFLESFKNEISKYDKNI